MSIKFKEKCSVTKWFWWRAIIITMLFAGLSGYFFYDWKVGYPKKNYKVVQYHTFKKAKEYFIKHVEMGRTPEQWTKFVSEQELEHHEITDTVATARTSERYPLVLQDFTAYKAAYEAHSKETETPVLWDAFLKKQQDEIARIKAGFATPPTKEDRRKLKGIAKWDEPMFTAYEKGEEDGNYRLLIYNTFLEAQEKYVEYEAAGKSAEDWKFFTSCRGLAFERDRSVIPAAYQQERWSPLLGNYEAYYKEAELEITEGVSVNKPYLWKEFTAKKKWGDKELTGEEVKGRETINEQLYFGLGVAALALIAAGLALRMKGRYMAVDDEAFYAPGEKKIPFSAIKKIDKRKWENKGLATLYYEEEGGETKKVRLDGMVYGQFDKEAGEPAEKLFQHLLSHFKGEIVELISDDEEDSEEKSPISEK